MPKSPKLGVRMISLALSIICTLCMLFPARASDTEQKQTTLTTVVRNGAYYDSGAVGQLEDGSAVTVLGETSEFFKIDCYDTTGYVARSQITVKEDKYYVNCQPDSSETRRFTYTDHAEAVRIRNGLLDLAEAQVGKPYIYGATGTRGYDCSGLMYYLYGTFDTALHRRASEQLQDGIIVSREGMQVGDLVFFRESWDPCAASHVGIYAGNNKIIHASTSRGVVYSDLEETYCVKNFLCVRRVVDTNVTYSEMVASAGITATPVTGRRAG